MIKKVDVRYINELKRNLGDLDYCLDIKEIKLKIKDSIKFIDDKILKLEQQKKSETQRIIFVEMTKPNIHADKKRKLQKLYNQLKAGMINPFEAEKLFMDIQ